MHPSTTHPLTLSPTPLHGAQTPCRERLLIGLNSWRFQQQLGLAKGGEVDWEAEGGMGKKEVRLAGGPRLLDMGWHQLVWDHLVGGGSAVVTLAAALASMVPGCSAWPL